METIKMIEGLDAAIKLLSKASKANANGSLTIWRMTDHAQSHLDKQIAELLAPVPSPVVLGSCADNHAHPGHQHNYIDGICILRGCKATQANDPLCKPVPEPQDIKPTPEEWNTIADTINAYTGLPTTLEGGGAACPFIRIELPDGRIGLLGDVNETWMVDLYASKEAEEKADGPAESLDLLIPTDYKGDEREYNLNPERIADELRKALRDVCIAGEPALAGRCGNPECVCHPSKDSAEQRTRTGNTPTELLDPESEEAEALLDAAKTAQTAYWDAVKALEDALGIEIDSTDDLQTFSTCTDLTDQNTI